MTTKEKIAELLPDVQEPYQLHDILRAIGVKEYGSSILSVNNIGGFRAYHMGDILPGWEDLDKPIWNLTTDYDNQTQEVKDFIGKLIGV